MNAHGPIYLCKSLRAAHLNLFCAPKIYWVHGVRSEFHEIEVNSAKKQAPT